MQKNKVRLLCTTNLSHALIDEAAESNVLIDAFSFIQVTEYRGNITPEDLSDENMEGGPIQMTPKPFKMEVIDC